jgi:hypothetical protein
MQDAMSSKAATPDTLQSGRRGWFVFLAVYSFILAIITAIPQFYYVLFALHLVAIGPEYESAGQGVVLVHSER